jgi:hypothetical protein
MKIFDLKTDSPEGKVIEVAITHNKDRKAYFLHFQPLKRSASNGFTITECNPMEGMRGKIEDTGRFSQKRMDAITANVKNLPIYQPMLDSVLANTGLKIVEN